MGEIRRKVFISYHHDDQGEVDDFIETFDDEQNVFIGRGVGVGMGQDIINSDDTDYVMQRIRELYLKDSTVTVVLIGQCTWARRYVDWEIQASLRHGETVIPNGLLGVILPSVDSEVLAAPERLGINLKGRNQEEGYARWIWYPQEAELLVRYIEDAFSARTGRADLIENPRERFERNKECG